MVDRLSIDAPLAQGDVEALFQAILRRPPDNPVHTGHLVASGTTLRELTVALRGCEELRAAMARDQQLNEQQARRDPLRFRCPPDLEVSPGTIPRVLMIGSCLMHIWSEVIAQADPPGQSELYLTGGALPERPARPIGDYDYQLVHLPLRSVLPDNAFARLDQADIEGHQRLLDFGCAMIDELLAGAMRWNREGGILTFVMPFIVPQQNAVGRLLPRYDLRNPVCFIERLNEALAGAIASCRNTYFFDLNEVLATHGRRCVQEDMITLLNHGAFLTDFDAEHDLGRMDAMRRATEVYEERLTPAIHACWQELRAMLRTLRGDDMVKLVVIDLDETLWRGTIGELGPDEMPTPEGWPGGFWEALTFLKRRGVLLAIVSNNDDAHVVQRWDGILHGRLGLDDFAARRIDWRPKAEKMAEILAELNLLARNVVFIDDNKLQRAELQAAFPDMRVLGGDPFVWRHVLLWAAETQVAHVTAESMARTQMVQAQAARETQRRGLPRAQFLASLNVQMNIFAVRDCRHPRFARVMELVNKTNQFNTTGETWTDAGWGAAFAAGVCVHAFDLADVHTSYGLVGVLILDGPCIRQFAMSCRIAGLEAELAAVAQAIHVVRAQKFARVQARLVETDRNHPCRNLYQRCGFTLTGNGVWLRETSAPPPIPAHITITAPPPA